MVTDPIADMLARIRNALQAHHSKLEMPSSRMKVEIAKILKEEGFLSGYKLGEDGKRKMLRLTLKYGSGGEPAISHLARVSRPGRRVYAPHSKIPQVLGGMGYSILTTPRGVMTGGNARKVHVGGEVLLEIW